MESKKQNMKKSIIMMICACMVLMAATYAWMVSNTVTDMKNLKFITTDTIYVSFWGYNSETDAYDIELDTGDLQLKGLLSDSKTTVRIKLERNENNNEAKRLYIKMLGVGASGADGGEAHKITVGNRDYSIADFISVNIFTVPENDMDVPLSITVANNMTGGEIYFSETTGTLAEILEIVQGYVWETDLEEAKPLFLDMTITVNREITVQNGSGYETLSINQFQKQSVRARVLNVQGVDV